MRKRSKYRPRPVNGLAWANCIAMKHQLGDSETTTLGLSIRAAITSMTNGLGTEQNFADLAGAVDTSLVLCERGVGAEYLAAVQAAQIALMRILRRQRDTGRWGFDGDAYKAIAHAIDIHEAQLAAVSADSLKVAIDEVRARERRGQILEVAA